MSDVFQRFTEWKRRQVGKRSLDKYLGLQVHVDTFFKTRRVDDLTEDRALDFRDWLDDRLAASTAR
ncbi:MAG: hypothetical protein AAFX51_06140 [Cyanobacteria bacterium J06636_28]